MKLIIAITFQSKIIKPYEKICKMFYTYFTNVTKGLMFQQVD